MRIAVTGATGFIGRRLCARLADDGHDVRALVRRLDAGLDDRVHGLLGTLDDVAALDELVRGADAIVHLAGAVRGVDRAAFDAVNVDGTRHLVDAILRCADHAHLVLVSSLAARAPHLSDYAASKRAAEDVVTASGLQRFTILRPTAVYGPGDVELQPLLEAMATGFGTVPAARSNRVTLIHVDDVVAAIAATLARPAAPAEAYELCDDVPGGYDWPMLAAAVEAHTGRRVRLITLPRGALSVAGHLNRLAARITGRAPMLTPGKARELAHPDWSCDGERFGRVFSWSPQVDLAQGLATVLATP